MASSEESDQSRADDLSVMGNKNSSNNMEEDTEPKPGLETGDNITESVSGDGVPQDLLSCLQSLGEHADSTLLPLSLHQIAEAYSLQEQYQCALQFLELEKLYHQRLLSNLAALQESWESQWKEKKADSVESEDSPQQMDTLNHICRTHLSPSTSSCDAEQKTLASVLKDIQSKNDALKRCQDEVSRLKSQLMAAKGRSRFPRADPGEEEEEGCEEGQEVEEETTPEEEELRVEWPTGVPQASEKDLAKLSNKQGNSSPDGLVSILKRRRASLDGLPPPASTDLNNKRKVRFSEPDDPTEHDEGGGDSCLILLLLCLVTVVISLGGTALYCTLVDTYSNICTDFTQNMDFYLSYVRRFLHHIGLPFRT